MTKQRTLEEALAGAPPRKYYVSKSKRRTKNPETGRWCAPREKTVKARPSAAQSKVGRDNAAAWRASLSTDPEAIRKHFLCCSKAGKAGAMKRRGLPQSGWRAEDWQPFWAKQIEEGVKIVAKLEETGQLEFSEEANEDRGFAREALAFAVGVIRAKQHTVKDQLSAAKTVLEYTKSKPSTKQEIKVETAEAFLKKVADDLGM